MPLQMDDPRPDRFREMEARVDKVFRLAAEGPTSRPLNHEEWETLFWLKRNWIRTREAFVEVSCELTLKIQALKIQLASKVNKDP